MWFKKITEVALKGLALATGVMPLIQGFAPSKASEMAHLSDDLTKIAGMVTTVELIGASITSPLPGAEKLKAASPLVAQVILQAEFMVGKHIKDEARFKQGVASLSSGMADVLSSISD